MTGRDKHVQRLKRLSGPEVVKAAGRVLFVGADMIKAEAQRGITAGSVSGKGHVASKPGQFPNNDTGTLKNGIRTAMTGPLEASVTSTAPYAGALEYGTSKMGARPYMRPSRDKSEPRIQKLFAKEIGNLIKRSGN
ncbi:HK97-gp10 family putative phage morphogenesis protein [Novosphingobium sp.]|uniref:HK97-gp10 family putative phage morphogenesis protein n=1 Tax=Novosphingobium sp. TaxID=1874826 RepID=UPI00286D850E|nr:HK97-gp10 family putative phage morphogenesis protein [Novosphingobium sp.]